MRIPLNRSVSWQRYLLDQNISSSDWWVWMASAVAWVFLFTHGGEEMPKEPVLCTSKEQANISLGLSNLTTASVRELAYYACMIVAMMFPLLSGQVKHVAFSVQRKVRNLAIGFFLAGYTFLWIAAASILSVLVVYLRSWVAISPDLPPSVVSALGFLIAAIIFWLPSRRGILTACERTVPIPMNSWQSLAESFGYGVSNGLICFRICWAPMLAMIMSVHSMTVMILITFGILLERYYFHDKSKIIGYVWAATAVVFITIAIF